MARPIFTVTSAARLDITIGSPTRHIYYDLVAQYQFGTPVIHGRSPQELATTKGIAFYNAPGDPGLANSVPGVVVVSFPYPVPSVLIGANVFPVDVAVGGGTIVGANYVDANGQLWPDVDWEWTISVEGYNNAGSISPGRYDQQVVSWVGDNTAGRLIPTAFPLNVGVVTIWICGGVGPGINDTNIFRSTGMPGSSVLGGGAPPVTTSGIMGLTAAGFVVTAGVIAGTNIANGNLIKYTAIVMRDTTADNRYIRVGTYGGVGNFNAPLTVVGGSKAAGCSGFDSSWGPLPALDLDQGTGSYTFTPTSAVTGLLNRPWPGVSGGVNFQFTGAPRNIINGGNNTTHAWIWGVRVAYRSFEFVGDPSISSLAAAAIAVADNIKALVGGGFTVGAAPDVNSIGSRYDYAMLNADATFLAQHLFTSFKTVGVGGGSTPVGGFGFTPGIAFAERFTSPTLQSGCIWRGPDHTGTDSAFCSGLNDSPTLGIRSLDVDGITLGTEIAPVGVIAYGWAFKGGTTGFAVPGAPQYVLVPLTPPPNPPAVGPGPVRQACNLSGAGTVAVSSGQGCKVVAGVTPVV